MYECLFNILITKQKKKKFHWKSWEILVQGNPQVQHAEIHINTEIFISYSPKFVSQLLCNPDLVLWFSPCGFRYLSPGVVEFRTRHSGTRVYTFEQCSSPTAQWVKSAGNAGDTGGMGSIPELGRSSGEANSNPLQYSCLKNPMDTGTMGLHWVRHDWSN